MTEKQASGGRGLERFGRLVLRLNGRSYVVYGVVEEGDRYVSFEVVRIRPEEQ